MIEKGQLQACHCFEGRRESYDNINKSDWRPKSSAPVRNLDGQNEL